MFTRDLGLAEAATVHPKTELLLFHMLRRNGADGGLARLFIVAGSNVLLSGFAIHDSINRVTSSIISTQAAWKTRI